MKYFVYAFLGLTVALNIFSGITQPEPHRADPNVNGSSEVSGDFERIYEDENEGYRWAESNNILSFSDCDDKFGSNTHSEDGCNRYVQGQIYSYTPSFNGYECTEDCSGHEAGYEWAEENDIDDLYDCDGSSDSFVEGCESYVEEYYPADDYEEDEY